MRKTSVLKRMEVFYFRGYLLNGIFIICMWYDVYVGLIEKEKSNGFDAAYQD
jgi:hypothetical protein